jgi:integrase
LTKAKGRHPEKALTAVKVKAAVKGGRYADGNGLYLVVDRSGAKRWLLRTVVQGRRRDIGLGGVSLVSLADARERAAQYRRTARLGGDPLAEKRAASIRIPTFAQAAESVHVEHKPAWRNPKHAAQWITTLRTYAVPVLGARPINQIDTPDILKVLAPIWLTKPETARRVRQRMRTVLDWAKAAGYRNGENPVDGVTKGLPKQPDGNGHHAALAYADVPGFITDLRASAVGDAAKLAFEFMILTATRTSEVLRAMWDEIDLDRAVWTIPAARMKAGREHRVPLSPRCIEILLQAKQFSDSSYVFSGRSPQKPLSNTVFLMALRHMKVTITAHGFRSAFRDWASESTSFPNEVCEMALAHTISNKTEAAYRRGDLFEKRRALMSTWAEYVVGATAS